MSLSSYNNRTTVSSSGGIGFIGLLTILFIAFKLLDVIEWSWTWVLSPIWIIPAILISAFLLCFIFALVFNLLAYQLLGPLLKKMKRGKE